MEQPVLSVIVPTYNSGKTLFATLKSITDQNFKNLECWIIDGGSGDNTIKIAEKFSKVYPYIQFISEPDHGIYDAMNKGIQLSKGKYLYFMGSDDVFYNSSVLNSLLSLFLSKRYDFLYGDIVFKHSGIRHGEEKNYLKLIKNLENINHQSIFYSRKIFNVLGHYDLRFPIYADFNFNIKCFKDRTILKHYVPAPICIFNEKGASFFHRDRDQFIESLHEVYVNEYEDPVALYDTVKLLEAEVARLLNSRNYKYGKKIGDTIRWLRQFGEPAGKTPILKSTVKKFRKEQNPV